MESSLTKQEILTLLNRVRMSVDRMEFSTFKPSEDCDFYQEVDRSSRFDFSNAPTVTVGRLKDDIEFLRREFDPRAQLVPLNLVHLLPILDCLLANGEMPSPGP